MHYQYIKIKNITLAVCEENRFHSIDYNNWVGIILLLKLFFEFSSELKKNASAYHHHSYKYTFLNV